MFRQAVEVDDNAICLNTRTLKAKHPRAITVSLDGGKTLSRSYLAKELIEPGYKKDGKPVPGAGCEVNILVSLHELIKFVVLTKLLNLVCVF